MGRSAAVMGLKPERKTEAEVDLDNDNHNHNNDSTSDAATTEDPLPSGESLDGNAEEEEDPMALVKKSRTEGKNSVLNALLPGAEIRDSDKKILVNAATSKEIVTFNIGGAVFETYRSTLRSIPHSPLADDSFLQKHFREDKRQYFFDRDPDVFGAILNYLRSGELHLPTKYCGPAVKAELEYWGIEEDEIEECCWTNYSAWTSTLEALKKLERDRKVHMPGEEHWLRPGETTPSKLRQIRMNGWEVMNSPQSSITAKIYSYISLTFVVISIFSFIAQTHEFFRVPLDPDPGAMVANSSATNATAQASNVTYALKDDVHPALLYTDLICLIFFISEFVLRFTLSPRKCKLLMLPMTVFELLALLPDLIEFSVRIFHPSNRDMPAVDVITFLRLLRVFRIFRLMRHFPGLWILFYTLKASVKELLLLLMFLCVGMLLFASLIYYADDRELFTSIPMACWWAVITMTTVGYGDMYPTTKWGYVVGSLTAICGVLVIGFTVPVLVNNFILYYQHTQCAINREESKKKRTKTKLDFQHAKAIKDEVEKQREKENPNVLKMERLRKLHLQHDIGTSSKDADSPKENGSGKECKRENDFNSNTHDSSYTSEKDTNPEAVSLL